MANRSAEIRRDIQDTNCALKDHSMSSAQMKNAHETQLEVYGVSKKEQRARRSAQNNSAQRYYLDIAVDLIQTQFDRICTKMDAGDATPEDEAYYKKYRGEFAVELPSGERVLDFIPRLYHGEQKVPFTGLSAYLATRFPNKD